MTKINKDGWEHIKLGEAFTLQMGRTPARDNTSYWGGSNKWIAISDLRDSKMTGETKECITDAALAETNMPIIPAGTTIMSFKLTIGKTAITSEDVCTNEAIMAFLPKESTEVLPDYLYYVLPVQKWEGNRAVMGKTINKRIISDHSIPLPPLPIQKRIVEELDEINAIISAKKLQLSKLDELAQSIFYNMFGDPVANEKGWEVKKLGEETTEIKYGTSSPACPNGQYKYLRMCNISYDGHLDFSDLKYIDVPDSEIEKCIVRYGDILFNRTNSLELIGKTCMFDVEEPMVIAGYIIRVRLTEKLHPRYVSVAFNLPSMKKLLRNMAKGAVNQANINSKELASINIPLPPLHLQETFAARVSAIEEEKAAIATSIEKMQTLLDARMQEYFG